MSYRRGWGFLHDLRGSQSSAWPGQRAYLCGVEAFDDILPAIPFEIDRPTGILAVQEVSNPSDKRAFSWIGVGKIPVLQQRPYCGSEY